MILTLPSFLVRRIVRKGSLRELNGIKEIALTGKIIRRTRGTAILFDSFSGISIQTNHPMLQKEIDKSIENNYSVHVTCDVERIPKARLRVKSVRKCTFYEEMYRTIEAIEFWKKVQFQKQPK
ncbi:hypothetical protein NEPAR06_2099 [Nematocida parisii]|uniref:OB domain-containing protein n=1 Tax=Nematocida parisii (strain ERTm3) TaxID=935791 RepID=I3EG07_NEMP3|nr:uncharacterized protein NEPG_01352 [Nematocida parisii ERTm1]EIJ88154.1 hypothetical protein NEQG_01598 [Nematocida parisii ERTm3]KAI5130204.1 hypothetical protein NEPAR08_1914 [Nematocida parisii]EIJ93780.1 hypothetical protein NEPG_01352 [Nematocida parisii ERTm1]KAI5130224.1 hypothetical protein NEPAR03_2010 [Nematocida parisii]KAI5143817.1 hypothetical protein NEPAR04_1953 [Nematocida parisii]|eukprot:XP_013059180.1 hypothetical protein NEPG_01352 [Nematocida parisii ERTm1]